MSRLASLLVLAVGILVGLLTNRITDVMMWIVGALYSGYVMANVLKWYWWRFNGHGFFWGMMTGILSAMIMPKLAAYCLGHAVNPLYLFPVIFGLSAVGCIVGALATEPEDPAILKDFYRKVRPWGAWGPIREMVQREQPDFRPNPRFRRDTVNVVVGIVWQLCLTALPICLVLQRWSWVAGIAALLVAATLFIKFNWFDRLEAD